MVKSAPQSSQRPPLRRWIYSGSRAMARLAGVVAYGIRFEGRENIPDSGPVLVCSNHQSHFDPMLVGMCSDRPMNYLARDSLFRIPGFKQLIELYDAIPIDREGTGLAGVKETLRRLKRGEMVLIFPEGSRTRDGELAPLKPGFLTLARRSQAAILPVGIEGAFDALPRHRSFPRLTNIAVSIGPAISPAEAATMDDESLLAEVQRRMKRCHDGARRLRGRPNLECDDSSSLSFASGSTQERASTFLNAFGNESGDKSPHSKDSPPRSAPKKLIAASDHQG